MNLRHCTGICVTAAALGLAGCTTAPYEPGYPTAQYPGTTYPSYPTAQYPGTTYPPVGYNYGYVE